MSGEDIDNLDRGDNDGQKPDKMFTLKKWNAVAMWSWDVECDTCAICRVQVMVSTNCTISGKQLGQKWQMCRRRFTQKPHISVLCELFCSMSVFVQLICWSSVPKKSSGRQ